MTDSMKWLCGILKYGKDFRFEKRYLSGNVYYGAKKYDRVRLAYRYSMIACTAIATVFFLCFQLFPHQIVKYFSELEVTFISSSQNAI